MSIRGKLILALIVAAAQMLGGARSAPAQDTQGQTAQDANAQGQSGSAGTTTGSSGSNAGTGRSAPAAALSGIAGIQGSGTGVDVQDTSFELPQIPALLGGQGRSMAFPAEQERSNYLRGGVSIGAAFDDNPLLLSPKESNTSESVFPNIAIEESTSRTRWTLAYAGGLTVNQKFTSQNQGAHNLNFDSLFRVSPHVNLRVAETFMMTEGYLEPNNGEPLVAGGGGANASLITPLATQQASTTTVEANYHFALNDLMGASGSYYLLNFTNAPAGVVLSNTRTASGSGFWLHKLFHGDWGGLTYRFERITFDPIGETRAHTFFAMDTIDLGRGFGISAFAGPQYSDNQGLVTDASGNAQFTESERWSAAVGVDAGWKNKRTSLAAGFSRGISDGGGVLGAERLTTVYANVRREIVPGWTAALQGRYGTNATITAASAGTATSIDLTSLEASVERNLGKKLGCSFSYRHDFQQQYGVSSVPGSLDNDRNRFAVTLSYQWAKPLGM